VTEVIIAGWMDYSIHRDQVLSLLQRVGEASLAEAGCLAYAMSADAGDPDRIQVFERWASREALDSHLDTAHVKEFRAAIAGYPRTDRSLHRFLVADVESF
jgi:quinol monooxygenase YgiN